MIEGVNTELTDQLSDNQHMNPSNYNDPMYKSSPIDRQSIAFGNYDHYTTSITKPTHDLIELRPSVVQSITSSLVLSAESLSTTSVKF